MTGQQGTGAFSAAIRQGVTLECFDPKDRLHRLGAELGYRADDPYAVTLTFRVGGEPIVWAFARDLLSSGLHEPSGDGDVHVWPCLDEAGRAVVMIELCSPDGELLAQARTADVASFVDRTYAAVAPGSESSYVDIDGLVAALVREAA